MTDHFSYTNNGVQRYRENLANINMVNASTVIPEYRKEYFYAISELMRAQHFHMLWKTGDEATLEALCRKNVPSTDPLAYSEAQEYVCEHRSPALSKLWQKVVTTSAKIKESAEGDPALENQASFVIYIYLLNAYIRVINAMALDNDSEAPEIGLV